jgi:D-tyrosyl-tRNA(Tyr) deacylase
VGRSPARFSLSLILIHLFSDSLVLNFSFMRVVIQRVTASHVTVKGEVVGKIGRGFNLLVGIAGTDTETELDWMVQKCLDLRLFPGEAGDRFDRSILEIQGEILVVSQFTLYGDCRKGRRPSFDRAAAPASAERYYEMFVQKLRQSGLKIETGQFGAMMQVAIENDGPVTLLLERNATTAE